MEYRVVGIRRNMEFDTKDGGKMSGAKVYMTCKDDRVDGCMTDSFFISTERGGEGTHFSFGPLIISSNTQ